LITIRPKKFFHYENPNPIFEGDYALLMNSLNDFGSNVRYHVHSLSSFPRDWARVSQRTVKTAWNRGHRDIEVWAEANPVITIKTYIQAKPRDIHEHSKHHQNWTLDLDNLFFCKGIDHLYTIFRLRCGIEPYYISRTSQYNYHALIVGRKGHWEEDRRLKLACDFAQVDTKKIHSDAELKASLKRGGVDPNYLSQRPESHKIRLPGSINMCIDGAFVVEGKKNSSFIYKVPEIQTKPAREKPKTKQCNFWLHYLPLFEVIICSAIGQKVGKKFAKFLINNLTYLKRNKLDMSQSYLAKLFGVTQPHISKLLGLLCRFGILEVQRQGAYISPQQASQSGTKARPKTYGIGPQLQKAIKPRRHGPPKYDLTDDYKTRDTNFHILADLRYLVLQGFNNEEISEFCCTKLRGKPAASRRTKGEIEWIADDWRKKVKTRGAKVPNAFSSFDLKPVLAIVKERVRPYGQHNTS